MFRTVVLSIIRSFSLCAQQWYMSYNFADSLRARSGRNLLTDCERHQDGTSPSWCRSQAVSKPVWPIPLLCVQWKTPDDGQRNCPKQVEFYSKNKFEKLVNLVGFIVRIKGKFIVLYLFIQIRGMTDVNQILRLWCQNQSFLLVAEVAVQYRWNESYGSLQREVS